MPKKALKKSQLEFLTAGPVVSAGSHQISRVNFIEGGVKKLAFYKPIDPEQHYPELLALISVATAALLRSFEGDQAADERLVFDDEGAIVGTLSIAIEGFKSLNIKGEEEPFEPSAKELAVPSTKTLIEKKMMKILFGRYFLDDDDTHPQNIGFAGDRSAGIDRDMFFYWFTIWMKEPRPVVGVPKKHISHTVGDWEVFPRTNDAKHYHWPTYERPGEKTLLTSMPEPVQTAIVAPVLTRALPKAYPDPVAFQLLANSPEAQEQKLAAALDILLTYQPEVLRARMVELFDNLPLNYTSLGVALSAKYETEFPTLCNSDTNVQPFVDFIMSLYQKHYDSLYRVVVFYMGCDNNGYGVPLPATYRALYDKPSFYKKVKEWVLTQNATEYSREHSSVKYDIDELKRRYHQVWRDAFAPRLKTLLHNASTLTNNVITWLKRDAEARLDRVLIETPSSESSSSAGVDESFTQASELFGKLLEQLPKEKIMREIDVEPSSDLGTCLQNLVDFTNELATCSKAYYDKSCASLSDEDNVTFVYAVQALCSKYGRSIRMGLANTSSYGAVFARMVQELNDFAKQADFEMHLTTTDEQMQVVSTDATPVELPLTHPDTLRQFNEALFLWAKSIESSELTRLINEIIDTYYTPTIALLSSRGRTAPVKAYLTASASESGNNRLAYILSSGTTENGALNMALVQYLTPQVLKSNDLPSIKKAVKSGAFLADLSSITLSTVQFAKTDASFAHLCHDQGINLFYKALFDWIECCAKSTFTGIVRSAIAEYGEKTWWSSRRSEVEGYCKTEGQAKAIALTFLNQGATSTLNQILFKKIVTAIQEQLRSDRVRLEDPGYKLLALYDESQHRELYLNKMISAATEASHKYSVKASVAASMSL